MSRVTAPVAKLSRAMGASAAALRDAAASPHGAGAALMPKYAELLRSRRAAEHEHHHSEVRPLEPKDAKRTPLTPPARPQSRGLATAHRPTPQPSIANRARPLMQTFHSAPAALHTSAHLDAAVIPSPRDLAAALHPAAAPRVPLLPDNYAAAHGPLAAADDDAAVRAPDVSIVAADPDNVIPGTPLSEVQGIALDGVELKFVHERRRELDAHTPRGGMLRDLWHGMVDDILGPAAKKAA